MKNRFLFIFWQLTSAVLLILYSIWVLIAGILFYIPFGNRIYLEATRDKVTDYIIDKLDEYKDEE